MKRALGVVIAVLLQLLSPKTAGAGAIGQPEWIPPELRVPPGHEVLLRAAAAGVQIYACQASKSGFVWVFRTPEAGLFTGNVQLIATHYGGPTWQALDGSRVTGMRLAGSDAPNPESVPWLLLLGASHEGSGTFSDVTYIQRVLTGGGAAPSASSCDAKHEGDQARVEYIAVYYFYIASSG